MLANTETVQNSEYHPVKNITLADFKQSLKNLADPNVTIIADRDCAFGDELNCQLSDDFNIWCNWMLVLWSDRHASELENADVKLIVTHKSPRAIAQYANGDLAILHWNMKSDE